MVDKIIDFLINKLKLNKEDIIVIGNSGGPDSMALTDILLKSRKNIHAITAAPNATVSTAPAAASLANLTRGSYLSATRPHKSSTQVLTVSSAITEVISKTSTAYCVGEKE